MGDDMGGDPACWLNQVCDECGAITERDEVHDCSVRLGTPPTSAVGSDDPIGQPGSPAQTQDG